MKIRKGTIFITVVFIFLNCQIALTQVKVKIATGNEDEPLILLTEPVIREAYKRIGMTVYVQYFPWSRAIYNSNSGNSDSELFRLPVIEENFKNLIRVNVPIVNVDLVVFVKDLDIPIQGWESLKPYRLGFVRGLKAAEANTQGMDVVMVSAYKQVFEMLYRGRIDVVIEERFSGLKIINELGYFGKIKMIEPPIHRSLAYHYVHVRNQVLVPQLEQVLQKMGKEGLIKKIQDKVMEEMLR